MYFLESGKGTMLVFRGMPVYHPHKMFPLRYGRVADVVTARWVVAFTVSGLAAYLLWYGMERFYYESWGTWIFFPSICVRMLPAPFYGWLLRILVFNPCASYFLMAMPVLMLVTAFVTGMMAASRNSLRLALLTLSLGATVFGVYHALQPLGVSYVLLD